MFAQELPELKNALHSHDQEEEEVAQVVSPHTVVLHRRNGR